VWETVNCVIGVEIPAAMRINTVALAGDERVVVRKVLRNVCHHLCLRKLDDKDGRVAAESRRTAPGAGSSPTSAVSPGRPIRKGGKAARPAARGESTPGTLKRGTFSDPGARLARLISRYWIRILTYNPGMRHKR
jgi:predicted membrane-bound mannosyltransferase